MMLLHSRLRWFDLTWAVVQLGKHEMRVGAGVVMAVLHYQILLHHPPALPLDSRYVPLPLRDDSPAASAPSPALACSTGFASLHQKRASRMWEMAVPQAVKRPAPVHQELIPRIALPPPNPAEPESLVIWPLPTQLLSMSPHPVPLPWAFCSITVERHYRAENKGRRKVWQRRTPESSRRWRRLGCQTAARW